MKSILSKHEDKAHKQLHYINITGALQGPADSIYPQGSVEIVAVSKRGESDDLIPEKVKSRNCSPENKSGNVLANLIYWSGCKC